MESVKSKNYFSCSSYILKEFSSNSQSSLSWKRKRCKVPFTFFLTLSFFFQNGRFLAKENWGIHSVMLVGLWVQGSSFSHTEKVSTHPCYAWGLNISICNKGSQKLRQTSDRLDIKFWKLFSFVLRLLFLRVSSEICTDLIGTEEDLHCVLPNSSSEVFKIYAFSWLACLIYAVMGMILSALLLAIWAVHSSQRILLSSWLQAHFSFL